MASEEEGHGSWWEGWIQTAKDTSASTIEFMKRDLSEFANTLQKDTTETVSVVKEKLTQENAAAATHKVKEGFTHFLGGLSKALTIPADDEQRASGAPMFDRAKARLQAIQQDPGTYLNAPDDQGRSYTNWKSTFVMENVKGEISEILVANTEVRSLYTQMVPTSVSHAEFWKRYFYKVYQLKADEARKAALKRRAENVQNTTEELGGWDDDDDWGDIESSGSPTRSAAAMDRLAPSPDSSSTTEKESSISSDSLSQTDFEKQAEKVENIASVSEYSLLEIEKHGHDLPDDVTDPHETVKLEKTHIDKTKEQDLDIQPASTEILETTPSVNRDNLASPDVTDHVKKELTVEIPKTKEKGDMVVVGSERTTPTSESSNNSQTKESSSLDEEWEKEFDIEVTEEDLKMAKEAAARRLAENVDKVDEEPDDIFDEEVDIDNTSDNNKGKTKGSHKKEEDDDWENWE